MREILLSGSGGQGMILAGIILAEAALREGKEVVQTQSYGPEARGGASKAEVIIANKKISFPHIEKPDVVLAMTEEAFNKYTKCLKENAAVIVDSTYVKNPTLTRGDLHEVPITALAEKEVGSPLFSNIVALGVLIGVTNIVKESTIKEAVLARVPKGTEERNLKALELGFIAGKNIL
ncbi:MAG: 2-oxoglutarate synthase [Peptococcaceae bacterium]|jgi:2-oxoglutarate ferredoxin oxidoreductase subunit gamma|uniref:2-oxoacid:ferredoxin oxidoreductase subunit gamma n=1 Tax=Thermanaerosceptrum fracticalcis TaxID=1712410 RepID=A0A7G6E7L5_THEFR|nr:2-oxoacid:acceptor oxidoreductase family protein [Thermanaerosceptrum fracticalcis]MBZ4653569.1 2-oxoglutarate synthase [Peptococcaceae bacterium]QNB48069.1 2-oxoacid:ferredoxin oxidoreductase subunit gamma [Thermanaerosceptrum fracticalcis]